MICTVLLH